MSITDERVTKGIQLRAWCKQDDDVQRIVVTVCSTHKVGSYAELAEQKPEVFDELYEIVAELLEESPSIGHLPGFMQ